MLHTDLSCNTRPEYAPAAVQQAVDKFLAYPKSQVGQLVWSLRFVVGNNDADRIRDAVLAFGELGFDGHPLAGRRGFPSHEEMLAEFAKGMRESKLQGSLQ